MSRNDARIRFRPLLDERPPKRRGLPRGYRLKEHYRARLEATAAEMRARYQKRDHAAVELQKREVTK